MPTDVLTQEKAPVDDERTYTEEGTHEHHNTVSLSMEGKDALMAMLGAYFAIGDQLASDTIENINAQAHAMLEAFQALEDETPADDLHFWHAHEPEAEMIYDQGHKLAELSDIKSARIAYGSLSDGLNRLVTALGVPPGYEKGVYGFVCGMAKDIPPNGIWLQIGENVRNPYFGKAMPKCHSEQFKLPVAGGKARGRGGVGARE
ncbi:DUF3347 domain-containing protein [Candidatus Poribacteria bacterium]|nr:DUF3347 domain-containing protein [Candidatus Poribacteria bacterium]